MLSIVQQKKIFTIAIQRYKHKKIPHSFYNGLRDSLFAYDLKIEEMP